MTTATPSPSLIAPAHVDGTLYFALFEAVAVWGWGAVLAELAEVARVRGDGDVAKVMMAVAALVDVLDGSSNDGPTQKEIDT